MRPDLDDVGGAKELALYRIGAAKEDLEAAEMNFESGHYSEHIEGSSGITEAGANADRIERNSFAKGMTLPEALSSVEPTTREYEIGDFGYWDAAANECMK